MGSTGRIALTFEAPPAPAPAPLKGQKAALAADSIPRVAARIFNPERPDASRLLIGEITNRKDDKRLVLHLSSPPAPRPSYAWKNKKTDAPPRPIPNPAGQHTLENDDVTIDLTCDETGLKGFAHATGDRDSQMYQFELVLKIGGK